MASVSDLNIRLGVAYREFDKSMRQVENRLRQSAQTIGGIADNMMSALTVPLAGIGALAIKASGDFEALRLALTTTMTDAGYSTQQVTKELEALRKVALAPGIDLEQAVKGSIRLQNVGISAEKARKILENVANAVAAAGGSAENLDSVTTQFAQMHAKGVVMASDLRIIQEAMPGITKAMQQAFGQTTAEGIRDAGISASQFIEGVTEQLAKNARVQGGVKNAIDNARSALMQFFASIGDGINEAYNLNQVAEDMSKWLGSVASAFRNLDPETKKAILNFALYAAAAGPVLKIFSGLFTAGQTLVSGLRVVAGAMANLGGGALSLIDKFSKLSTAMKFTYIGAAIAVIGLLYAGFQKLNSSIDEALHVTRLLNDVEKEAQQNIAGQKSETELLIGVLQKETSTREEKINALNKLKAISPEYFGQLSLEKDLVNQSKIAYDKYIDNIYKAARAQAARGKLEEIAKQELTLQELKTKAAKGELDDRLKVNNATKTTASVVGLLSGNYSELFGIVKSVTNSESELNAQRENLAQSIDRQQSALDNEKRALGEIILASSETANVTTNLTAANNTAAASTDNSTESSKKKKKAVQEETATMKELLKTLDELDIANEQLAKAEAAGVPQSASSGGNFPTLPQRPQQPLGSEQTIGELENLVTVLGSEVPNAALAAGTSFDALSLQFQGLMDAFSEGGAAQKAIFDAVGASIVETTNSGSTSLKEFARNAVASSIKVAKAYAVQGIFAAVSSALKLPFPINLITAGVAAGAAGALLNGLANRIQPPKLAKGGLAYGPTLAMVGDNPGAASDPEVISPLSKLQNIMGSAGQMISLNGNFKIRGQDLELVLAKAAKTQQRIRGK